MIDVHSHILPKVDDGAIDWVESIIMAKIAVANGIKGIIATPHHRNGVYDNTKKNIVKKVNELNLLLKRENIPVHVFPGNETQIYDNFIKDLKNDQFLTLNDNKKYVLVELPYYEVPKSIEQLIFGIQLEGYIPIIPHPERNEEIRNNPLKIYQLVKKGALIQITSSSLLGVFNKDIQKFAFQLIDHNLAHLIATDAHKAYGGRKYNLKEAYYMLEKYVGEDIVDRYKKNAENILLGRDIYVDIPIKIAKRKKIFKVI